MKALFITIVWCLFLVPVLVVGGCGKKADENKPMSEVKAEAETMSVEQLRSIAMKYKEAITAKQGDVKKIIDKLAEIPLTEKLGQEAKGLQSEIDDLNMSINALKERFEVYYNKLKENKGDLAGLEI